MHRKKLGFYSITVAAWPNMLAGISRLALTIGIARASH
jgi:hypothetical protein